MTPRSATVQAPPTTVANYVAAEVRAGILQGQYPLGSRIDQHALADELGASIIPVREALRRLEAEGLVRIYPRKGAFVAEFPFQDLGEINLMRERLEALALELAIRRLTAADIAELKSMNELLEHVDQRDSAQWDQLNREWHLKLYSLADAEILQQTITMLWDRTTLYRTVNAIRTGHRDKSIHEHAAVLACCSTGDVKAAVEQLQNHIRRSLADVAASGVISDRFMPNRSRD
jgi:DNA-binding GntR family transcriptional regulator